MLYYMPLFQYLFFVTRLDTENMGLSILFQDKKRDGTEGGSCLGGVCF